MAVKSTQNSDKFNSLPYDCIANISSFLTVGGISSLVSAYKTLPKMPGTTIDVQVRELVLRLNLENPASSGRALLRAIDQDKIEIVSTLLSRGSHISADVGVVAMQMIQKKKSMQYYAMFVTFPPRYQLLRTHNLQREQDVMTFMKPLLNTKPSISPDWLGQALIQISERDELRDGMRTMSTEAQMMAIGLLLNNSNISPDHIGTAFVNFLQLSRYPRSNIQEETFQKTLMFFLNRAMPHIQRAGGLFWAARYGYRSVVAFLIKSLNYEISCCKTAFITAAGHGRREIVLDFLNDRLSLHVDSAVIGAALTEAAKVLDIDILQDLLASTPDLPDSVIQRAIEIATARRNDFRLANLVDEVVQLLQNYRL